MMYKIGRVDGHEDEIAEELNTLQTLCFGNSAPRLDPEIGTWWMVCTDGKPIGFSCLRASLQWIDWGFLALSGVLREHQGNGLQKRMIRVRERYARRLKLAGLLTYTIDNPASANSLMRCGYKMYTPRKAYAEHKAAIYWRKFL